jgi:WD40 repeat protein
METSANWVTACAAPAGSRFDFVISTEDADESKLVGVNIDQEDVVWEVEAEARVHDLCFLPDGRHLVAGGDSGVLELWDTEGDEPIQQLDLREDPVLAGEFGENEKGGGGGLILTTPTLDGESYPPWTIHSLDVAPNGSFATLGLANGLVLEVGIER